MNYDSSGKEILPSFLYPCPARCGSTNGCSKCRLIDNMTQEQLEAEGDWNEPEQPFEIEMQ